MTAIPGIASAITNASTSGPSTKQEVNGMGTGVIIDPRGYIVTNYHVVDEVGRIEVTLADGMTAVAQLINYDPETDLALIKIPTSRELPVIEVGPLQTQVCTKAFLCREDIPTPRPRRGFHRSENEEARSMRLR
jgi:S1-C subfamily serine protease